MFNQRQWDELSAFASAAGQSLQNHGFVTPFQQQQPSPTSHPQTHAGHGHSQLHQQFQFQQQQQQQQQQQHQYQQQYQLQHHQQQQQQQPSSQPQDEFFPGWARYGDQTPSPTPMHGLAHGDQSIPAPLQPQPSGSMDWAPSSGFGDFTGHAQSSSLGNPDQSGHSDFGHLSSLDDAHVKQEGGNSSHMMEASGSMSRGVDNLASHFEENKNFNPPLPPRPTNSTSTPIAITQQSTSQFNHFGSSAHQPSSFATNGFSSPGDSMFGSFNPQSPMASPIATSPPPLSFNSFQNPSRMATASPAAAPTSDPFSSLDSYVGSGQFGHVAGSPLIGSPMVGSPAPSTPGVAPGGTPGFAIWKPPQQSEPTSQPQPPTPQFLQHQQPQHQALVQPKIEPDTQPQPLFDTQFQSHQPQHTPSQPEAKPTSTRARVAASLGGFFRPSVPTAPKPSVGSQFILELNPGAKAKGKAPAKPARLRAPSTAPKPEFITPPLPTPTVIKQQPSTPQLSEIPAASGSLTAAESEPPTPRPMGNRPSREQVPPEAWEQYKATIRSLYLEDRKPLKEVMSIMADKYNFQATPKMYKTRFSQWGFVKNNTEDEVKRLLSMKFQRDSQGKVSEFVRNGKIVNLGTYLKRKGVTEYDLVDFELPADLPSHIRCRTPTPPPTPDFTQSPDLIRAQELVVGNMRKAFLQCRQIEVEMETQVGWGSTMIWGVPSSEQLTEANFFFEAQDMDQGGQCSMEAFKQLEVDLRNLTPQGIMEVLLGMVRRETSLMTTLCKYVAAFSTTNYERSHPLRQVFTCLYEVQQKHGSATLSELLWATVTLIAEELEAIYSRRHPYVARTWIDLALFYSHKNQERLDKLALELRALHRQMEQRNGLEASEVLALRYTIAQLHWAADPSSSSSKGAANDLWKDMKKANLVYKIRDPRPRSYCYHCPVKVDPWSKRCKRRYDVLTEMLEKYPEVKITFYFEEDFHTSHHEQNAQDAFASAMDQHMTTNKWSFI